MSIGYETQLAPIQTLTFYNAIANNGVMVKPKFVEAIIKDGLVIKENPTEVIKEAIASPKTIQQIQYMLEEEVNGPGGTGKKAGSTQFRVSGKTGTAQVSQGKGGYHSVRKYLVSFCGYFPSKDPKYTCIVAIQKPGLPASGGLMSGAVFHEISERIYAKHISQNIEEAKDSTSVLIPNVKHGNVADAKYVLNRINVPSSQIAGKEYENITWGKADIDSASVAFNEMGIDNKLIPNVHGMGAKDAVFLLESLGLKVHISGMGKVTSQSIQQGSRFSKGQSIHLTLK